MEKWGSHLGRRPARVEPNANTEPHNAHQGFTEFVHEVDSEKRSSVMFIARVCGTVEDRIMRSALEAIRDYPEFRRDP